ncbi:hypothetical protein ACHAO1_005987 [Botrytis cinerea]
MSSTTQPEFNALTEFLPFSRLPLELQTRIFREAQPDPMVNGLYFTADENGRFVSHPLRYGGLSSLLLACKESYAETFRSFGKFEVVAPPSFVEHVGKLCSYFRPGFDILLVQGIRMLQLYDMGGSLSLGNITQLALDDIILESWYCPRTILTVRLKNAAKLYTFLSNHCPALSKLWMIVETETSDVAYPSSKHLLRMLDISDGLTDLDLRIKYAPGLSDSQKKLQRLYYRLQMEAIKEHADMITGDFDRFLNTKESDPWSGPRESTLKYWKTRRPAPALMSLIAKYESGSNIYGCEDGNGTSSPWLWVPTLKFNIACHADGTPVHNYKGLAQMFGGEPW